MGHLILRVVKIYMKSVEMDFFPAHYTHRWFLPCEQAPAERAEGRTGGGGVVASRSPPFSSIPFFSACCSPYPGFQRIFFSDRYFAAKPR